MAYLDDILSEIENFSEDKKDLHKKKLSKIHTYISAGSIYKDVPVQLLESYYELTEVITKHQAKNPTADLSIYERVMSAMRSSISFLEHFSEYIQKAEHIEAVNQSQSRIISDLQSELMQYQGIEVSIRNNTIKEKIGVVLKKMEL